MLRRPRLIIIDRLDQLASGTRYVLSFIEVAPALTVVRFIGLDAGFAQEIVELAPVLRDDTGHVYPPSDVVTSGLLLPEEVMFGFSGAPGPAVRVLKVVGGDRRILQVVRLR
jgi:hypothetical protein